MFRKGEDLIYVGGAELLLTLNEGSQGQRKKLFSAINQ